MEKFGPIAVADSQTAIAIDQRLRSFIFGCWHHKCRPHRGGSIDRRQYLFVARLCSNLVVQG
jgi:hypothetical protein